ncbi:prophage PSPPH04, tail fiber domain protein [Nitrospirillum viridazoti Y2]|uniref:Lysophospholipase L1-like esterase n=1 Tax=Nitrospirillum amazonense TaxID=28077 RepID=A0A560II03_9PROT|nr:SGNH/GDSL hydrolase family protein [Nitrospirillum amazonense]EGY02275.1 prophage PSPPH04, tail fiber domain protein [Nitrospirillum amazonense Y2]TWB58672.1 hypothetical protein FBZ92_109165 [Nitrospirillum amazonense]
MAIYSTGTVIVQEGSINVVGAGTAWLSNVKAGDILVVVPPDPAEDAGVGYVNSVTDDTHLVLQAPWNGADWSNTAYQLYRDFIGAAPLMPLGCKRPNDLFNRALGAVYSLDRGQLAVASTLSLGAIKADPAGSVNVTSAGVLSVPQRGYGSLVNSSIRDTGAADGALARVDRWGFASYVTDLDGVTRMSGMAIPNAIAIADNGDGTGGKISVDPWGFSVDGVDPSGATRIQDVTISAGAPDGTGRKVVDAAGFMGPEHWAAPGELPVSAYRCDNRAAGIRATWPCNTAAPMGKLQATYRSLFETSGRAPFTHLRFAFQNLNSTGYTEALPPGSITITASIEVNPNSLNAPWAIGAVGAQLRQLTFNGQASITIAPGGTAWTDPIYLPMAANQLFYVRTFRQVPNLTGPWPCTQWLRSSLKECSNDGYFNVAAFTPDGTSKTYSGTISGTDVTLPLVPGSITIGNGGLPQFVTDNGSGAFPAINGLTAGTINYTNGAWTLTYANAPPTGSMPTFFGWGKAGVTPGDETLVASPSDVNGSFYFGFFSPSYGPSAIQTKPLPGISRQKAILFLGDSNAAAAGNNQELVTWVEQIARQAGVGVLRMGQGAETAAGFLANCIGRLALCEAGFDRVIIVHPINDLKTGASLATMQQTMIQLWSLCTALAGGDVNRVVQCALVPQVNSTADNTPYNAALVGPGTVASGSPSMRNAMNYWLAQQEGLHYGTFLDVNLLVENSPGSRTGSGDGKWVNSTAYPFPAATNDGYHFSTQFQEVVMPAFFGPGGAGASPVFIM